MTADTSVVVAALCAWHDDHEVAAAGLDDVGALPAHVVLEAYSVLTRLPAGLAVPPGAAAQVMAERFDESPLRLSARHQRALVSVLSDHGVVGGATYDGLVALEAGAHGQTLLTLDRRAEGTYRRLGVPFRSLAGPGAAYR